MANAEALATALDQRLDAQVNLRRAQAALVEADEKVSRAQLTFETAQQQVGAKFLELSQIRAQNPEFKALITRTEAEYRALQGSRDVATSNADSALRDQAQARENVAYAQAQLNQADAAVRAAESAPPGGQGTAPASVTPPAVTDPPPPLPSGGPVSTPRPVDDPAYGGATDAEAAAINQALNQGKPVAQPQPVLDPRQAEPAPDPVVPQSVTVNPSPAATNTQSSISSAQVQPARSALTTQPQQTDWRLKISLAKNANYLYKDPALLTGGTNNGILLPLFYTDGVLFPYTPEVTTAYRADYDAYNLTHSNYRGYFYKSSYADNVNIRAVFTAQDGWEADYMLAVIHFFRSVTKMFYGQDTQAGAPPPVVYMTGLGKFQYNNHPCLVSQFNYDLPSDVDYVRAGSYRVNGQTMLTQRPRSSIATNPVSDAVNRLKNAFGFVPQGGQQIRPAPRSLSQANVTYVPTKLSVNLTLLPLQSRRQVSQAFNLRDYASGTLLNKGFW